MPNSTPLSRTKALRLQRVTGRLVALFDPLDALHGPARGEPASPQLAGEARRTLVAAAKLLGRPLPNLDSPLQPGVILTSSLTLLEEANFLLKQTLAARTAAKMQQSFPRRLGPA